MRKLLSHPATNAVCISIFSAFYAVAYFITARSEAFREEIYRSVVLRGDDYHTGIDIVDTLSRPPAGWSSFLYNGAQVYIAYALLALTALVVFLLLRQRATYDEYHTAILTNCLLVAMVLVLLAIAVLFVSVVLQPVYIVQKFMAFATLHWATVVLADLVYVLFFRR